MKKIRKRKLNLKRILLAILLLMIFFYFANSDNEIVTSISSKKIVKHDSISSYSGIGQEKVSNQDGYFTTFTTENGKTYKEYKQNGNSSWSAKYYWGDTMAENGCGITVMSIVLSGYNKNYTPEDLRKKYYPVMDYENFSSELRNTFKIENSDFYYDSEHLSNDYIIQHLNTNRPVIVCVWNKPNDNRWTTASHYMVLLASDGNNMVYVSNPNGLENDSKSSGWYDINEVTPYLAKAIFIESYE